MPIIKGITDYFNSFSVEKFKFAKVTFLNSYKKFIRIIFIRGVFFRWSLQRNFNEATKDDV